MPWLWKHQQHLGQIDGRNPSNTPSSLPVLTGPAELHGQLWRAYAKSIGLVVLATLLGQLIHLVLHPTNLVMLYLLVVVVAAVRLGRGPAIVSAVVGVLVFDFFFISPHLTFAVDDAQYLLTFSGLLLVGLVISALTAQARAHAEAARERAQQTAALYALSRDLASAIDLSAVIATLRHHMTAMIGRDLLVLLSHKDGLRGDQFSADLPDSPEDRAAVEWTYTRREPSGRGTNRFPAAQLRYYPLMTAQRVVGIAGLVPGQPATVMLTPEQRHLVEALLSQAAVAIERVQLAEEAQEAQVLRITEQLQTALLNSISHDLRTPLASIMGALSSLRNDDHVLDDQTRRELVETAWEETERMNRLVANLLDMTRLEAGTMTIRKEACDIQDVVGVALSQLGNRLANRPLIVDIPSDLPLVPIDLVLMAQVLVNILDNAAKYSPPESPIEIRAQIVDSVLELVIADRGIGIPPSDLRQVFEKFYRVRRSHEASGTGLGLSISKGIVEAHGGIIVAACRPGGGTCISLHLPCTEDSLVTAGVAHE